MAHLSHAIQGMGNFLRDSSILDSAGSTQISVYELHNDLILPLSQGEFRVDRNKDGRVCIGDNCLRDYMTKHINPMIKRNKITCVCETCISYMLLQYDFNKWCLTKLVIFEKFYINAESTRLL